MQIITNHGFLLNIGVIGRTEDKWLWRLSTNHGSMGTLGDIGVHIFDFASFPIGTIKKLNARLKTFKSKGEKIKDYIPLMLMIPLYLWLNLKMVH
jgi:predicted dehydrogenase